VEPLVTKFVEIMNQEVGCFTKLLDLLMGEQKSLIDNDIDSLQTVLQEQDNLLAQISGLEKKRLEVSTAISQKLKVEKGELTIGRLTRLVKGCQGVELEKLGNTLLELQRRIETANRNNKLLIKQSMRYVDRCLNILTGEAESSKTYAKTGRITRNRKEPRVMDREL